MGLLKKLTQLKNTKEESNSEQTTTFEEQRITYFHDGKNSSRSCRGRSENLKASLDAIYYRFENKCKEEDAEQNQLKQPYVTELKGKRTTLLNREEEKEQLKVQKSEINNHIERLKQDAINARKNPRDYGIPVDNRSTAKFWIGLSFLIPLSVYLFIFYVSTSYSGFFRDFNPSVDLFGGMFYPQALSVAYEDGLLELGFIIFIPFVFFGLGYLIHMFQHKKSRLNVLKVILLFVVTFLFDAILAYLIDEKIYNLNKTYEDPVFSIAYAFRDPSFWVIIFAGFISYIIWGLVFDFVMKEHSDRDKIQRFIDGIQLEINNTKRSKEEIQDAIEIINKEIRTIKERCSELENIIDGFILPIRNYKALSAEYLQGWQEYISASLAMGHDETRSYLDECRQVYDDHIKKLDLDVDNYQNKVYTKTL
ncbi:hypothetical protein [Gilvibacter sediminis]|uniref:hypothetical protein n=1 Tax=Gilvibacter sediminis TaxID=379071 RepID=UPI0023502E8F|nr:hypothetical protein [Gilvibacter sediminis]MDC7997035.1 hypothetical protein [Gilvibacter sediminis]